MDYTISTARFIIHSYHDYSNAQKNLANAKLGVHIDDVGRLTLILNSADSKAANPDGSTESERLVDPQQSLHAEQFNTRRIIKQTQAGLRYERQLGEQDNISIMTYAGERGTTQYQLVPMVPQLKPSHVGGVITLQCHYQGTDNC